MGVTITASVTNSGDRHQVEVSTQGVRQTIAIPSKASGTGSGVNGGELLFLALATCYCNDIYREAALREISVQQVEVEVSGEFGAPGECGSNIRYSVRVQAKASETEIADLIRQTDAIAEIHNTLRRGAPIVLADFEAISS